MAELVPPVPSVPESAEASQGIAAVERETGISKDTLRIWERRYGFPVPLRDASSGERVYPAAQVQKLRLLKRLVDGGHRPRRVVPAELEALQQLLESVGDSPVPRAAPPVAVQELEACLDLLRLHDVEGLRRRLSQAILRMGLGSAVLNLVSPLTTQVGDCWMRGELDIFQEHAYSEALHGVMRQAMQSIPKLALADQPRVLLSTLPGEEHGLGLLMAEAMLNLEGCPCLSLGVQTPVQQLVRAAAAHRADVVGLSFSSYPSANVVLQGLAGLRAELGADIEIWVGGRSPAFKRRLTLQGTFAMSEFTDVPGQVARWRAARAGL